MAEQQWNHVDLGPVEAYAQAVAGGYTGTKEEWIEEIAKASINAQTAHERAKDSEAYARGTRDGVDVDSEDPAYHNNSKFYAQAAEAAAETASSAYDVNLLADNYSAMKTYKAGDIVIANGSMYRCSEDNPVQPPPPSGSSQYWKETNVDTQIGTKLYYTAITGMHQPNQAYSEGDLVTRDGRLYQCNTDISAESWNPSHWTETNVMEQIAKMITAAMQ